MNSWKEISSYLNRSIKTCQLWEVKLGLPIHRLDGTPSARVFADPAELDAWIAEKLSHIRERPESSPKRGPTTKRALRIAAGVLAVTGVVAVPARVRIWHSPYVRSDFIYKMNANGSNPVPLASSGKNTVLREPDWRRNLQPSGQAASLMGEV